MTKTDVDYNEVSSHLTAEPVVTETAPPAAEASPHQAIEGLSGFTFMEGREASVLTEMTFAEADLRSESAPEFLLDAQVRDPEAGYDPISAIAMSAPAIGGIPLALCDEALMGEINSIPDRLAFKIGDVADLVDVKTYVLRYWETEFDILNPKKSKNNQRVYSRRDVENVMLIKKLLYRDRFSIEGARAALKQLRGQVKKERTMQTAQNRVEQAIDRVQEIRAGIQKLRRIFA